MNKFQDFVATVKSGQSVDAKQSLRFARLFKDDFTIDNLSRTQLVAMCKLLLLKPYGTDGFLRWQIEREVKKLIQDDKLIVSEGGVDSLDYDDLKVAARERGLRTVYRSDRFREKHLREQLKTWLNLSVEQQVPISLLLLTQAFMITQEGLDEALSNAIRDMPDLVLEEAQAAVEIDKRARRQLALHIAEEEIERIREDEQAEDETDREIAREESDEKHIERVESLAEAVALAAGQSSLLSEERESLKELKEQAEQAKAEAREQLEQQRASLAEEATLEKLAEINENADIKPDPFIVKAKQQQSEEEKVSKKETEDLDAADPPSSKVQQRLDNLLQAIEQEAEEYDTLMKQMVKVIDEDADGVVSKEEMRAAANLLKHKLNNEEFEAAVRALDIDGDGLVKLGEMQHIVDRLEEEHEEESRKEAEKREESGKDKEEEEIQKQKEK
eukprot:CAMPEP_0168606944 /NCGR_PEP_ID=MMETSP0420-20121227/16866_1 /TAXON_ID=498008 /ORGANISM="Pessonella sp." /LENGTH=444 /DNA_ID=CAMNT_0008646693 /DNA_START=680 /DNA_END=2011 /DNA_ORIENTATION=+